MINNNKPLWDRDDQGNLHFNVKHRVANLRTKPDTLWNHPLALIVIITLCAFVDFMCFKQLFDSFLLDSPLIRWTGILGMIFAFDFVPVYLGLNVRKRLQKYNVSITILIVMGLIFTLAFAANIYLRISFKDLVMPDLTTSSTSIFGSVSTESTVSSRALPYAIFAGILPLLTSIGSFTISFLMANPLKAEKLALDTEHNELADSIGQIDALLQEYEADPDFYGRLMGDDENKYGVMKQMIREKRDTYRDYVRERIKEFLGNPTASNVLSNPLKEVA